MERDGELTWGGESTWSGALRECSWTFVCFARWSAWPTTGTPFLSLRGQTTSILEGWVQGVKREEGVGVKRKEGRVGQEAGR